MLQKFVMPDGSLQESNSREQSEKLVAAGGRRVPGSFVMADVNPAAVAVAQSALPHPTNDIPDPNASTVTISMLLNMTINAQLSYLQGLSDDDLTELHDQETRKGALENIESEIERRTAPDGEL